MEMNLHFEPVPQEAFETEEDFEARLQQMDAHAHAWERQHRRAALWDRQTREEMIRAMHRLAAALEKA